MREVPIKTIDFGEIGPITFYRNFSGKQLKITIKPDQGVRVMVPQFVSLDTAGRFVKDKKDWIRRQQIKFSMYAGDLTQFDINTSFRTNERTLIIRTHEKYTIKTIISKDSINIWYPVFADVKDKRIQQAIRKAVVETWRLEALKTLPPVVDALSKQYGLFYNNLRVRNNKSRWGSCSRDNNISLNLHLVRLPCHLRNYVILHELAHTLHKNHQERFWNLLDRLTGDARKLDRELSNYRINIW